VKALHVSQAAASYRRTDYTIRYDSRD